MVVLEALLLYLCVCPQRPHAKDGAPNSHLPTAQPNRPLKVLTHPHAQLQPILRKPQFLGYKIPLIPERHKVLILRLRSDGLAARNGADGHEAQQVQARARLDDVAAQGHRISARPAAGLGILAGCVDLHMDGYLG